MILRTSTVLAAGTMLAATAVTGLSPASAAGSYDPNMARVANPANACKSIPGSVGYLSELFGMPIDTSAFDYDSCVRTLARGEAYVDVPGFGDPYAQCDFLVSIGVISYPSTLHDDPSAGEDAFLPDLTIKNRKQCGSAIYAYHSIVSYLPGEPA